MLCDAQLRSEAGLSVGSDRRGILVDGDLDLMLGSGSFRPLLVAPCNGRYRDGL
jgi:hypothetical protein